ncbi:MAG: hypothetical protein LBD36_00040 [Holosporales bacterium]|jgi:hypothetical protein|nr:hypothetical protein [Holosporales bacterium]
MKKEQLLVDRASKAQILFTTLFHTIEKLPLKKIDYYEINGRPSDTPDVYPVTLYSKFLHLKRTLSAFREYTKLHLPENVIDKMTDIIGQQNDKESKPTLCCVINELITCIPLQYHPHVKNKILYLLGVSTDSAPQPPLQQSNLPSIINLLFAQLFDVWREYFVYPGISENNVFALLTQLQTIVQERQNLRSESEASLLIPFGSIHDGSNSTFFGKALLAQKIVGSIINTYNPLHYPRIHHLITHESCSVSNAIIATIHYLSNDTTTMPHHTIANRLDCIHKFWKNSLIEKMLVIPNYWPKQHEPLSLQMKITTLYNLLHDKKMTTAHNDKQKIEFINKLIAQFSCTYEHNSICAKLVVLSNILLNPNTIIDDESFDYWIRFIGCSSDNSNTTLFGIVNSVYDILSIKNTPIDAFIHVVSLIGEQKDWYETNQGDQTLQGVLNRLFANCFDITTKYEHEVRQIPVIGGLSSHLDTMYRQILTRTDYLFASIRTLVTSHQFDWADLVVECLHTHVPKLVSYLKQYGKLSQNELFAHLCKPLWSNFEIFGELNAMINAVIGGGINRVFNELTYSKPQRHTLAYYLNSINKLTQSPNIKGTVLHSIIGDQNNAYLGRTLTLNDRFRYLQEIIGNISIFEDTTNEWYTITNVLLNKFQLIHTALNVLSRKFDIETFQSAVQILGYVSDLPSQDTVFGVMNSLFYNSSSSLFGLILDKYKAGRLGLIVDTRHSLFDDLQTLKEFLEQTQTLDITDEFNTLGATWHNAYAPSVFGRLISCEDTLIQLWNNAYYIPIYDVLELAAQFYDVIYEIIHDGYTHDTLKKIGTPISNIDEHTLFGVLNHVIATCLTSPLGHNVKYISDVLPTIIEKIFKHPAMQLNDKITILSRIVSQETLQELFPDISIEMYKNIPLSILEEQIAASFYPIAGFFRFHQAEQLWILGSQMIEIVNKLDSYINQTVASFNPVCPVYDKSIPNTILATIGTATDFENENTLFAISNKLGMRIHEIYSTLQKWHNSPLFVEYFQFLDKLKQIFFPGDCQLYYLTNCFFKINQSIANIKTAIQSICSDLSVSIETRTRNECDYAFRLKKHRLFDEIEQNLEKTSTLIQSIAKILPHVLGEQFYEILRCVDLSEYAIDAVDNFHNLEHSVLQFIHHLGYSFDIRGPERQITNWTCSEFTLMLNNINTNIAELSQIIYNIGRNFGRFRFFIIDRVETGTWIENCSNMLRRSVNSSIPFDLRKHEMSNRKLHCNSCRVPALQFENFMQSVQELTVNLSFVANAFLSYSQISPLQTTYTLLTGIGQSTNGVSIIDELFSETDPHSLPSKVDSMCRTIQQIMRIAGLQYRTTIQ